ncbi:MAG: cyclic nucleotide-binding domain-containing protein [Nitrospirae bacterium]|nr:cyclic nucleotide-binding domain-containing protein [Nitrospirota bacterium]
MSKGNWEIYFDAVKKLDWPRARKVLNEIVMTDRDNPQVYLKIGDVCQREGDAKSAIEAYHASARLLSLQGFNQKAVALYKIILRLDPRNAEAVAGTEKLLRELEDSRSAQQVPVPASTPAAAPPGSNSVETAQGPDAPSPIPGLFSGMSREDFAGTLERLAKKTYPDGSSVIEEGGSGDSMYLISSGRARVVAHILGREIVLAGLTEGDLFGEVAFLSGRPRTASVIAEGPLEVYEIGRADIETLLERNPEILSKLEGFYEARAKDTVRKAMPGRS